MSFGSAEFEVLGLDDLALDAFLEHIDQQFPPYAFDAIADASTENSDLSSCSPVAPVRKRPRSESTSNSDDSNHAVPKFSSAFPLEPSDELLAKNIAAATERDLKALNIDPSSKEGKKQKRLIRNRMSAQLHRERKREHLKHLEEQLVAKDRIIQSLQARVAVLEDENAQLRANIRQDDLSMGRSGSQSRGPAAAGWSGVTDNDVSLVPFDHLSSQAIIRRPHSRVLLSGSSSYSHQQQPKSLVPYDESAYAYSPMLTTPHPPSVVTSTGDWEQPASYYEAHSSDIPRATTTTTTTTSSSSSAVTLVPPHTHRQQQQQQQQQRRHQQQQAEAFDSECDSVSKCNDVEPLWQYSTSLNIYPQWRNELLEAPTEHETEENNSSTQSTRHWGGKSRLRGHKTSGSDRARSHETSHSPVHIVHHSTVVPAAPSYIACTSATTSLSRSILPTTAAHIFHQESSKPRSTKTRTPTTTPSPGVPTSSSLALVPSLSHLSNAFSMSPSKSPGTLFDEHVDPTLLMVLPANSIRWRSDGSHMVFDMNARNEDATNGALHDIIENFTVDEPRVQHTKSDIWVEIRCKVVQARLLNNVEINQLE